VKVEQHAAGMLVESREREIERERGGAGGAVANPVPCACWMLVAAAYFVFPLGFGVEVCARRSCA
jgi:hypothetical protein